MIFEYPYTDMHELNLDWFLAKFKELYTSWEELVADNAEFKDSMTHDFDELDLTVQNFISFVNNYFNNLDVQTEINNKLNAMATDGTLSELLAPIVGNLYSDLSDGLTELSGRVDELSTLTEGSTTGDAELADIRVSFTGATYTNAGSAVRGQTRKNDILVDSELNYDHSAVSSGFNSGFNVQNNVIWYNQISSNSKRISNINASGTTYIRTDEILMHEKLRITIADGYSVAYTTAKWNVNKYETNPGITFTYHTGESEVAYNATYPIFLFMVKANDESDISASDLSNYLMIERISDLRQDVEDIKAGGSSVVTPPIDMTGLNFTLYKNAAGYGADISPAQIGSSIGVKVYVSPSGSNSNTGLTVLDPVKTIDYALTVSNVESILLLPGTYVSGTHFTAGLEITSDTNMIALGDVTIDNGAGLNNIPITFKCNAYVKGITFKHGNNTVKAQLGSSKSITFEDCIFAESDNALWSNGLAIVGGYSYIINCQAYKNAFDGFNYHEDDVNINKCIEYGCKSYNNGYSLLASADGQSSNATTTHAGSKIIRVNGDYYACHGGIVADLNARSANYGCKAGISTVTLNGYPDRKSNYWISGSTAHMYLYDCKSYGSMYDTAKVNSAALTSNVTYDRNYS